MGNEPSITALELQTSSPSSDLSPTSRPAQIEKTKGPAKTEDVLILVNKAHKLPDDYTIDLATIESVKVDKVLIDDLKAMRKAAQKENISIRMESAYRTKAEQEKTFNNAVSEYVKQGLLRNTAVERAKQVAALPGYSEHETGLAIDFSFEGHAEKQAKMWNWLRENAYKYGFILRYPEGAKHITGYTYEPWHYRYVGKQHAKAIYNQGLVLEEYLSGVGINGV